jgi:hypothetical protein
MAKSFSAFIPTLKRWGLPAEQVKKSDNKYERQTKNRGQT